MITLVPATKNAKPVLWIYLILSLFMALLAAWGITDKP
jgi:hypothetical protein